MNLDRILSTLNQRQVAYLLIGGVNFLLRHEPILTFDIDLWIEDSPDNRRRCEAAMADLAAEWGRADADWGAVADKAPGWLDSQAVFCLASPHGAIDLFRSVQGLADWRQSWERSLAERTASGVPYQGLSDDDMLRCQEALDEGVQKRARIETLRRVLGRERRND